MSRLPSWLLVVLFVLGVLFSISMLGLAIVGANTDPELPEAPEGCVYVDVNPSKGHHPALFCEEDHVH